MSRAVLAAVLLCLTVPVAHGQQPVICANCYGETSGLIADAKQVASWAQQVAQMKQQLQAQIDTYSSLAHLNPRTLLTGQALENDMMRLPGADAAAVPDLNYGQALTGAGQQPYDQNHLYTPKGNDFAAQEMQRRQVATANIQGEALTGLRQAQARRDGLTQLENSLPSQPDVQAVSAMNARINAEQMHLANEDKKIKYLQLLQTSQDQVDRSRAAQHSREQSEQWGANVAGQAWGN